MKDRAPMFHPSDDHCFPEIHIIISEFHVMYVLSLFCTYYISLFEYFLGLKALKILSIGNTQVNMTSAALQGVSYSWLLGSH